MYQVPKFVSRADVDLMRKLVDLKNLAVYCDTKSEMIGHKTGADLEVRYMYSELIRAVEVRYSELIRAVKVSCQNELPLHVYVMCTYGQDSVVMCL